MNQCTISGVLATDVSTTTVGTTTIAFFRLKNETYVPGGNNRVSYIPVKFFGKRAEAIVKYFKKDQPILVNGTWAVEVFKDQQGQTQTNHVLHGRDFEFMGKGRTNQDQNTNGNYQPPTQGYNQTQQAPPQNAAPQQPVNQPDYNQNNQSPLW